MRSKAFLEQAERMKKSMDKLTAQIAEFEDSATRVAAIRYDKITVQQTPTNKIEEYIIKTEELVAKLTKYIEEYSERYKTIMWAIDQVPDPKQREVLKMRYLEGMTFTEINEFFGWNYESHWVYKMHHGGLIAIEKILEKNFKKT